jgi:hypothetical protein
MIGALKDRFGDWRLAVRHRGGWLAVQFLHSVRATVIKDRRSRRDDGRDRNAITASGMSGMSEKGEDIRQDHQEDRRAGDRKRNGRK